MPPFPHIHAYKSSLVPILTEANGTTSIGTGILVRHKGVSYVVGAEHDETTADVYRLGPVLTSESSVYAADDRSEWTPAEIVQFDSKRHPILLKPRSDVGPLWENRHPLTIDILAGHRSPSSPGNGKGLPSVPHGERLEDLNVGDDVQSMGFWAKRPGFPAQLRQGVISVRLESETFLDMKVVHGNSGGPVWRSTDGRFVGCAQLNMYDDLILDRAVPSPAGAIDRISTHANLILVQSPLFLFEDIR